MGVCIFHQEQQIGLEKYVRRGIMKWFYIAVGLIMTLILMSILSGGRMYINKDNKILPLHIGVNNGQ